MKGSQLRIISKQGPKHTEAGKGDHSEIRLPEGLTVLLRHKRPFTPDDVVHIRERRGEAPEPRRRRRDNTKQQSTQQGGATSIHSQADEEREGKQLWIERWKEGGEKRHPKVNGRGRKPVGILEESKRQKKSKLTPEEIQQRRREMLPSREVDDELKTWRLQKRPLGILYLGPADRVGGANPQHNPVQEGHLSTEQLYFRQQKEFRMASDGSQHSLP